MNNVSLLGRIAEHPELKTTQSGKSVMSFDLAVQGLNNDAAPDYIPIVCWDKTAEFVNLHLGKGRQIVVVGRLTARKYTDKDGNNRKAVEVVASRVWFADSKKDAAPQPAADTSNNASGFQEVNDEDLPYDLPPF